MRNMKRIIVLLLAVVLLAATVSCVADPPVTRPPAEQPNAGNDSDGSGNGGTSGANQTPSLNSVEVGAEVKQKVTEDREGNPITLPDKIDRIISMGPSNTEIIAALGFADRIIAADEYSDNIAGLNPGIPKFSMMQPDGEQIISLMPDVIFVTGMSKAGGDEPFKVVSDVGICLIYMPSSTSLDAIMEDIRFVAAVLGAQAEGEAIVEEMEREIDIVRAIGDKITDKKSVYFEISAAPWMYSFGSGVFLHEMIGLIGAVNIFEDQDSWISVADEVVLAADPDVILTSVNYIENPIEEIKSRPGWGGITAVSNGDIYFIDTDASNRPSHNVVIALLEMAKAVYPEQYKVLGVRG